MGDPSNMEKSKLGGARTPGPMQNTTNRLTPDVERKIANMVHAQDMGEKLRRFVDSPGVLGEKIRGDLGTGAGIGTGDSGYDAAYMDMIREQRGGPVYKGGYQKSPYGDPAVGRADQLSPQPPPQVPPHVGQQAPPQQIPPQTPGVSNPMLRRGTDPMLQQSGPDPGPGPAPYVNPPKPGFEDKSGYGGERPEVYAPPPGFGEGLKTGVIDPVMEWAKQYGGTDVFGDIAPNRSPELEAQLREARGGGDESGPPKMSNDPISAAKGAMDDWTDRREGLHRGDYAAERILEGIEGIIDEPTGPQYDPDLPLSRGEQDTRGSQMALEELFGIDQLVEGDRAGARGHKAKQKMSMDYLQDLLDALGLGTPELLQR